MTDKEKLDKLVAEIERRYVKIITLPIGKDEQWEAIMGAKAATLHSLLSFIDSMQEEPVSEDLEEAIRKYEQRLEKENPATEAYDFASAIRFGANWQKQQMMANAVGAQCFGFQDDALFSFRLPAKKYLVGSEVKVIVIKEA